jgi:signal transduction histidine kinase
MGLGPALQWLSRQMGERHGLIVEVSADADAEPADDATRAFLFQAARELLFNIVKHAGVDRAELCLDRDADGRVCLRVADTGRGLDPAAIDGRSPEPAGFGLFSIRERLAHLGGQMDVESVPGVRTRIALRIAARAEAPAAPPSAEGEGVAR